MEPSRVGEYKARSFRSDAADARRRAFLQRQKESREKLTEHLRELQRPEPARARPGAVKFRPWRRSPLSTPDWMNAVPARLERDWMVSPRAEGTRCVVIASNGATSVRSRGGKFLRADGSFASLLPGGGLSKGGMTVLDGIVSVPDAGIVHVVDVMVWNGLEMYHCAFEFRQFWLHSRLEECGATSGAPVRFVAQPFAPAGAAGLVAAYDAACSSGTSDGLLFYHREGYYSLGVTPLQLRWKDPRSSRYTFESSPLAGDEGPTGSTVPPLHSVLRLGAGGVIQTGDDLPLVVARASVPLELPGGRKESPAGDGEHLRFLVENPDELCFIDELKVGFAPHVKSAAPGPWRTRSPKVASGRLKRSSRRCVISPGRSPSQRRDGHAPFAH